MPGIVFLTTRLARGGAETQFTKVMVWLKQQGWQVRLLTMMPSVAYLEDLDAAAIPHQHCGGSTSRPSAAVAWRTLRHLRRWRPRILVTFNFPADILGRVCGAAAGVPSIVTSLRTASQASAFREWVYRLSDPLVTVTSSNTREAITRLVERGVLREPRTCVVPNGMATAGFPSPADRDGMRAALAVPPDAFLWLAVGNLLYDKDYPTLLEAASRCAAAEPRFRLRIAGAGADLDDWRRQAAARGLQEVVGFLGPRADIPDLHRAADAFVLSSLREGMPNAVMEAMASGLPVVATQVGAVGDLVEPGITGLLAPARNPLALADRMLELMALDGPGRARMGQRGRQRILDHFAMEAVGPQWERLFNRLGVRKDAAGPDLP